MFSIQLTDDAQLRPLEPWQAEEFLAHMDRAREQISRWIRWASLSADLESARATLQNYADKQAQDTGRVYGIWLGETLVGGCMFASFDKGFGNFEVGVWTEPAGQGRGLITAAVRHLLDYAFLMRGMERAEWHCDPRNERSRAVAKRLGMTVEGVYRSAYPWRGERQDMEVWGLLRDEWIASR